MAQPLQTINLVSPAFKGINTEDSPLAQDTSFAEVADNAIIDKRGQLAARKGISVLTTDATELGSDYISQVFYFEDSAGNTAMVMNPDNPTAAQSPVWKQWSIDLQSIANEGVNLQNIKNLTIGVGDKTGQVSDATGTLFIDDIGLHDTSP